MDVDSDEAKNVRNVPILLGAKLDKYHGLNEEVDILVWKTFCCFAIVFIHNINFINEFKKLLAYENLLIKMVTHWHCGSIFHPQSIELEFAFSGSEILYIVHLTSI